MALEPLILTVDDEPGILKLIKFELSAQGLRVIVASNGEDALSLAEQQRPDLVILDITMPDMTGLEVMRRLRGRSSVPVILLTAMDRDEDKVRGLELGADDYMVKPFYPEELSARVRAVLRRSTTSSSSNGVLLCNGGVTIDLRKRRVTKNGKVVSLTRTEWQLLQQLAEGAGKVLDYRELLAKVWGPEYVNDVQYLRVWVSRLRSKLETNPSEPTFLRTLSGIGYLLEVRTQSPEPPLPVSAHMKSGAPAVPRV